ncbi:MAG: dienelactone hydrolase family protein [Alphaproteobacteria bacterium]|nr:dienelactone hydrolase family protein [Alphaproteobacteria bacterium]
MGRKTEITSGDGFTLGAWVAEPQGAPTGAVVVLQEIFGGNKHIREVTDGYAADGFYAIAPQLFDRVERDVELGYGPDDMQAGIAIAMQKLDRAKALEDVQAAINDAVTHGKVGVVGYCFGGLLTWLAACELRGVSAASSYYGGGIGNETGRTPKCPVIAHFGEKDAHIPMADVEKLKAAHPDMSVFVYPADHGFNCDHRASYDAESAKLAKARTLAFFTEKLA